MAYITPELSRNDRLQSARERPPNHVELPLISIVIPVYNGGADMERCLSAIDRLDYPNRECILVDDASTDGMAALAARSRNIKLITLDEQHGPAFARNVGAGHARGEILFFTDADVVLDSMVLSTAAKVLDQNESLAAVFGSYDDQPGHPAYLSQYRNLLHHWVHQTSRPEAFSFWSGCGAVKKKVFNELGGFSTEFTVPSIEDIEFGTRARRAGHAIRLEKTMLCKHLKRWQFGTMVKTDVFRRAVPWMELILRERKAPVDLNLDRGSRIATAAAGSFALLSCWLLVTGQVSALLPAMLLLLVPVLLGVSPIATSVSGRTGFTGLAAFTITAIMIYSVISNPLAIVPIALLGIMVAARIEFYRFLYRKRSAAFALAAMPMQFIHFLGCAIAVPIGLCRHLWVRRGSNAVKADPDGA